jgi:hypothetical protein
VGLIFKKERDSFVKIIISSRGNVSLWVMSALFLSSLFVTQLYRTLNSGMIAQENLNASDVHDIAANALLDYVIVSIKSQWCVGENWTKLDCKGKELSHNGSLRRMLLSENSIMAHGDYFIRNVISEKKVPLSDFPSCASALNKMPAKKELAQWKDKWLKCIRFPALEDGGPPALRREIANITALPGTHPLKKLFDNDYFKKSDLGKVVIYVDQILGGRQFSRNGREIAINVKIDVHSKSNPAIIKSAIASKIEVTPAELNHFGLVLAGDMYMDGSVQKEKGAYFPLSNDNLTWPGINFDSQVYINGNIILPKSAKKDQSSFVRFNSSVYLSDKVPSTNEEGAVCRGYEDGKCIYFISQAEDKLTDYMSGFAKGIDHMIQDKGLEYIAGPQLGGLADGDNSKGKIVQACSDLSKSLTDFRYTNNNNMVVLKNPNINNEYLMLWTNNGNTTFNQRTLNRFSTPQNNIPRGHHANCYEGKDSEDRLMRPHIYNNNNSVKVPGRRHKNKREEPVTPLPAYNLYTLNDIDLTSTAGSLNGDLLIKSPMESFDSDAGKKIRNTLKKCPKNRTKDQLDAIDGVFKEKAAAVVNMEYGIVLQDSNQVQSDLRNQTSDLSPADAVIVPTMTNAKGTGIIDYIESLFPKASTGTMYTAKALMAVNTKLIFQGVKDGLIESFIDELDASSNGSFAAITKSQLNKIEELLKGLLGTSDLATVAIKITGLKSDLAVKQQSLDQINGQIASTNSTITTTDCVKNDLTGLDECTTTTTDNPAYQNLISQRNSLQAQIAAQQQQIAIAETLVARHNSITHLQASVVELKSDLEDLRGADKLGRSVAIEEVAGVKYKFGTVEKDFFAPNILKLKVNLPKKNNQFVKEFFLRVDAFDPSYVYTEVPSLNTEAKCNSVEAEPGVVGIFALTSAGTRRCLELRSTRLNKDGKFPKPNYNLFTYQFKKSANGDSEQYYPEIYTNVTDVNSYLTSYKGFSMVNHPGFNEFKCNVLATKAFVPDELPDSSANAQNHDLDGDYALSDQSLKSEDFAVQTNHSWFFTETEPFMTIAEQSYDPSESQFLLDITTNTTGPEFPVKSIMSRCMIHSNVTFVAGFYVCRELIIQGGRSAPLETAGTFIVGRLVVEDSSAAKFGIYFRNIYHQYSVDNLRDKNFLNSEEKCYENITQPIWYGNLTVANRSTLDRCVPSTFRDDAQAFTWNMVDPDCGIITRFANADSPALIGERMACKDEVNRFFVIEKGRGFL